MNIVLENELIRIELKSLGAEMISFFDKEQNKELLWQGSEESWRGQAPNLFPFIGRLKEGRYWHEGKEYQLKNHGFARNTDFAVIHNDINSVIFELVESKDTLEVYPFRFVFLVKYELKDDRISITYTVKNPDDKAIYFGVGGHTGFNIPSEEGEEATIIDGNTLVFERDENPNKFVFDDKDLMIKGSVPSGDLRELKLSKGLFSNDTILLSDLKSRFVDLIRKDEIRIRFWFFDCPYLAVWTYPKRGGFVCVEPWLALPDYSNCNKEIKDKVGICSLKSGENICYNYEIQIVKSL